MARRTSKRRVAGRTRTLLAGAASLVSRSWTSILVGQPAAQVLSTLRASLYPLVLFGVNLSRQMGSRALMSVPAPVFRPKGKAKPRSRASRAPAEPVSFLSQISEMVGPLAEAAAQQETMLSATFGDFLSRAVVATEYPSAATGSPQRPVFLATSAAPAERSEVAVTAEPAVERGMPVSLALSLQFEHLTGILPAGKAVHDSRTSPAYSSSSGSPYAERGFVTGRAPSAERGNQGDLGQTGASRSPPTAPGPSSFAVRSVPADLNRVPGSLRTAPSFDAGPPSTPPVSPISAPPASAEEIRARSIPLGQSAGSRKPDDFAEPDSVARPFAGFGEDRSRTDVKSGLGTASGGGAVKSPASDAIGTSFGRPEVSARPGLAQSNAPSGRPEVPALSPGRSTGRPDLGPTTSPPSSRPPLQAPQPSGQGTPITEPSTSHQPQSTGAARTDATSPTPPAVGRPAPWFSKALQLSIPASLAAVVARSSLSRLPTVLQPAAPQARTLGSAGVGAATPFTMVPSPISDFPLGPSVSGGTGGGIFTSPSSNAQQGGGLDVQGQVSGSGNTVFPSQVGGTGSAVGPVADQSVGSSSGGELDVTGSLSSSGGGISPTIPILSVQPAFIRQFAELNSLASSASKFSLSSTIFASNATPQAPSLSSVSGGLPRVSGALNEPASEPRAGPASAFAGPEGLSLAVASAFTQSGPVQEGRGPSLSSSTGGGVLASPADLLQRGVERESGPMGSLAESPESGSNEGGRLELGGNESAGRNSRPPPQKMDTNSLMTRLSQMASEYRSGSGLNSPVRSLPSTVAGRPRQRVLDLESKGGSSSGAEAAADLSSPVVSQEEVAETAAGGSDEDEAELRQLRSMIRRILEEELRRYGFQP